MIHSCTRRSHCGTQGRPERVSMERVITVFAFQPDDVTSLPFMGGYVAWSGVGCLMILP